MKDIMQMPCVIKNAKVQQKMRNVCAISEGEIGVWLPGMPLDRDVAQSVAMCRWSGGDGSEATSANDPRLG